MGFRFVFLTSDIIFFLSLLMIVFCVWQSQKKPLVVRAYNLLFKRRIALLSFIVIMIYLSIAIVDSIHFQLLLPKQNQHAHQQYGTKVYSLLDVLMGSRATQLEKTYSSPFALHQYVKESNPEGGQYYPRLKYVPDSIKTPEERDEIIIQIMIQSFILTVLIIMVTFGVWRLLKRDIPQEKKSILKFYLGWGFIFLYILVSLYLLSDQFHVLGTGKIGQDIFYYTLKSIRTGILIGLITTMVTLVFALILGISAGYYGGRIDDVIQYLYITISSIPGVLLIAASVLSMQVFIVNHPAFFSTLTGRADARLIILCVILGLTSWTGLCRMLRAESMKIKEIDYIQAARALGSPNWFIICKHILPNVMHIIVIATVLDFSFLVLAEAVLSYIGVGVSPLTISWGNMINGARLELAREPIVWWPIFAAFIFMFKLVTAVNLFADAVRDVFDPRMH